MRSWFLILAQITLCFACRCSLTPKGTDYWCLPENCTDAGSVDLSKSNATKVHMAKVLTAQAIVIRGNDKLTFIDLSALTYTKELSIDDNSALELVQASALTAVNIANLDGSAIVYPALTKVLDQLNIKNSGAKYVNFPVLNYSAKIEVSGNKGLARLDLPALTRSSSLVISDNSNMSTVQFGDKVEMLTAVTIDNNPALQRVWLDKSTKTAGSFTITNNAKLSDIHLQGVIRSDKMLIEKNAALKLVQLPNLVHTDSLHISDLVTSPSNGCVFMNCFNVAKDFDVFKCGQQETTAPMCTKKETWNCKCK